MNREQFVIESERVYARIGRMMVFMDDLVEGDENYASDLLVSWLGDWSNDIDRFYGEDLMMDDILFYEHKVIVDKASEWDLGVRDLMVEYVARQKNSKTLDED